MAHVTLKSRAEVRKRRDNRQPGDMFSYIRHKERVPAGHLLRPIRALVDTVLRGL